MPAPRRVVSLACSNTEIVCALGCADRLVGVDSSSDWPPAVVAPLPRVGRDLDVEIDRVAALAPDLVLATLTVPGHETVIAGLEAAGLPYVAPEPVSLADVYRDIREIAALLGVRERGAELSRRLEAAMPAVDPPGGRRPPIAIQWWPRPAILPGRLSWATDLVGLAGGASPLGGEAVKSRPVADEELAAMEPAAIVLSWCGVKPEKVRPDVIYENPALAATPAVRHRLAIAIPEAFLGRPSPRLLDGYRALVDVVRRCPLPEPRALSS